MTAARAVLVTGGNGFIGRHLVRRLLDDGCQVTLLQRLRDGLDPRTTLLHVDRLEPEQIAPALAGRHFDWLFHLAGYGVRPGDRDAATMLRINVDVPRALIGALAAGTPRAVVFAGSGSEYKFDGVEQPVTEDHALEPYKLYGASKAAGNLCAAALASAHRIPFAACRIFGVYGPGEAPHRLLPSLVSGLRRGQRVPLSPGLQRRDFLFVDDLIGALILVAFALEAHRQQLIVNIGTGLPIAVREFARAVAGLLGVAETYLGFGDLAMRADEAMVFSGNSARLHALTGWTPKVALREGVRQSLQIAHSGPDTVA
jgi:nucleoside-diphosphate-sugar epimerase